jgi:hypothetical protein
MLHRFSAVAIAGVTLLTTLISVTTGVTTTTTTHNAVAYPLINCMDTNSGNQELVHFHRVEVQQWHDNATVSITGYGSGTLPLPDTTYGKLLLLLLLYHSIVY